jgi:hypothetical protein
VYDEAGRPVAPGKEGFLLLKRPWPAMLRTIYKPPERYVEQYWSKYPGVRFRVDSVRKDEDGYFWIIGRGWWARGGLWPLFVIGVQAALVVATQKKTIAGRQRGCRLSSAVHCA